MESERFTYSRASTCLATSNGRFVRNYLVDRVVASLLRHDLMLLLVGPLLRPTVVCAVAGQTAIE
jgi:hypothetical protein